MMWYDEKTKAWRFKYVDNEKEFKEIVDNATEKIKQGERICLSDLLISREKILMKKQGA